MTRRDFLKAAGAGTVGATLLGTSAMGSGCDYLPSGGATMNAVLVIIDSLRKDHVGAYGNGRVRTPNLDALARESMRFERAHPESLPTIPARRAIHTGLRTWPFRDWKPVISDSARLYGWQPIPEGQATLAEILQGEGHETMFVTDTVHQFKPFYDMHRGFGVFEFIRGQESDYHKPSWLCPQEELDRVLLGGPNRSRMERIMRQYLANTAGRSKTEEDRFTPRVFSTAIEYLEGAVKGGQPFFLTVDCFDPHEPWDPPEEYVRLYDDRPYDGPEPKTAPGSKSDWLTERQLERMRALYAGEVTMVDRWLGYFLEKMEELDLFDNTLLLLLSDHGVPLGEHGYAGKLTQALYPELLDVPFFIRHPEGKGAGESSDYFASTHDVAPTILGTLGVEPPEPMDGQDLSVVLDGGEPEPRPHFSAGYHNYVWTRDDRYVMFGRNNNTNVKLFDLSADPGHEKDVADELPDVVEKMFEEYVIKDAGGPLPNY